MTTELAKKAGLNLFAFVTGEKATAFALSSKERRAVAVFEEEHAHFYVFWVAVRPTPKIKKFHERIAQ
jgi:rubrerythrin